MPKNFDLVIDILRLLCPFLKEMAARTDNEVDDLVVSFICSLVTQKEGGD